MNNLFSVKPELSALLPKEVVNAPRSIRVTQSLYETDPALLTTLLANGRPGDPRLCGVIENYLTDTKLASFVQPDLFCAMQPFIWEAWQMTLLSDTCGDATSELVSAFFRKPTLIHDLLGVAVQRGVEEFVRDSLLYVTNVDADGTANTRWVPFWVSLCACWPGLVPAVWDDLALVSVPTHARALLSYLARLAYADSENPLLPVAARPVDPWAQSSFDSGICWGAGSVAALETRLEWDEVTGYLKAIVQRSAEGTHRDEVYLVATDIQEQRRSVFIRRRASLFDNLGRPGLSKFWSDDFGAV